MIKEEAATRELTTLEFVILGFFAIKPQSGYDIMNYLETGLYRLSASTGSIYPVLKRLEKAGLITSHLEAVHEARPRKIYTLLPAGESILDRFLRAAPTMAEVIEEFDIAMHKFIIMGYRLTRDEVLQWIRDYENVILAALNMHTAVNAAMGHEMSISLHAQLVNESIMLEIQARLNWIRGVQARLTREAQ